MQYSAPFFPCDQLSILGDKGKRHRLSHGRKASVLTMLRKSFSKIAQNNLVSSFLSKARCSNDTSLHKSSEGKYDLVIVGGGIVGLATARELGIRYPQLKFAVLEKESELALHQTGHNSGVIHAGVYYKPGSLKAKLCVQGLDLTYKYCDENNIPYKKCGKLIVAVEEREVPLLHNLLDRAKQNGVRDLTLVDKKGIKEIEPNCEGLCAIHSPHTGIVDWGLVARKYAENFRNSGGDIFSEYEVTDFIFNPAPEQQGKESNFPVTIHGKDVPPVKCKYVITCAGLHADRLAKLSGCSSEPKIVPFRGEYLVLKQEKCHLVKGNIYPVPDPKFPFLGVHFTPRMDGSVWLGPNAVLAFAREGYKFTDFNFKDLWDALSHQGLRKLIFKYFTFGVGEYYRSFFLGAQVKQLQKYVPSLKKEDIMRVPGPAGVRAQAIDSEGNLVDDFVFDGGVGDLGGRMLHVRNAPSPAATSSLAIAKMVADEAAEKFHL